MKQHLTTEQLIDYQHGGLTPQEDASVYAHLEACAACRAEYDAEAALSEMLRGAAKAGERELPAGVKAAIWQQIRNAQPTTASRIRAWFRPALALPVAAVLAVGLYFGSSLIHSNAPGPVIEAAYYLQDHDAMNGTVPFADRTGANAAVLENSTESNATFANETAVNIEPVTTTADAIR